MCEYMSFFVHREADKLPLDRRYKFGDLKSHTCTAEAWGIPYGVDGDDWAEVEWTGEDEASLNVRDGRSKVLKAVILADFPTRDGAVAYALRHLPDKLTTLDLSGATVPSGIKFPDKLTTLYLPRRTRKR